MALITSSSCPPALEIRLCQYAYAGYMIVSHVCDLYRHRHTTVSNPRPTTHELMTVSTALAERRSAAGNKVTKVTMQKLSAGVIKAMLCITIVKSELDDYSKVAARCAWYWSSDVCYLLRIRVVCYPLRIAHEAYIVFQNQVVLFSWRYSTVFWVALKSENVQIRSLSPCTEAERVGESIFYGIIQRINLVIFLLYFLLYIYGTIECRIFTVYGPVYLRSTIPVSLRYGWM